MYFSLVKLFKWTFSDYASDYAMQVLHMQNLANIKHSLLSNAQENQNASLTYLTDWNKE